MSVMGSVPTLYNDFRPTHHFYSGVLLTTVYRGNYKLTDSKKRIVVFEKGTYQHGEVQRLAIYHSRSVNVFAATRYHRNETPRFQISLNENDLRGLIKGVQSRRVRYGKYVFSPTITIVTKEATVMLTATESDYERSMRQHDLWYNCLKNKLHFGGYWSVEHEKPDGSSSTVTLCVSKCRLSLLTVSPDDHDVFVVQAEYSTVSIVCWKLYFTDRQRCHVAYLSVTVAPDNDPANFERLRFRIDHNETVASDISEVLSSIHLPRMQRAVRTRMTPQYLDLQLGLRQSNDAEQLSPVRRCHETCRAPVGKRRSRDDLDAMFHTRPTCPPPRRPPKTQRHHQHLLNSYDLNALSCTDSVKDAVHFYQNIGSVIRQRPRRPPDVVASHLDEDEEYWSIVFTLSEVLRKQKPEPDTLRLTHSQRLTLCFSLLDDSVASWKNLAEYIGLKQEAVRLIETLFRCNSDVTPTECVLRHWQFVHNRSVVSGAMSSPTTSTSPAAAAPPCTWPSLINILNDIGRYDLVVKLSTLLPAGASSPTQL